MMPQFNTNDSQDSPLRRLLSTLFTRSANSAPDPYSQSMQQDVLGRTPAPVPTTDQLAAISGIDATVDPYATPLVEPVPSVQRPRQRPTASAHLAPTPAAGYDTQAMDDLTAQLSSPVTEGPNARIDDATRQRALAWALRQNNSQM
jgi:hypothetical protein